MSDTERKKTSRLIQKMTEGSKDPNGHKIIRIIGKNYNSIVYQTKDKIYRRCVAENKNIPNYAEIVGCYGDFIAAIKREPDELILEEKKARIALALYKAISTGISGTGKIERKNVDNLKIMKQAKKYTRSGNQVSNHFAISLIISAFLFIIIIYSMGWLLNAIEGEEFKNTHQSVFWHVLGCGLVGAILSVLMRRRKIEFELFPSITDFSIQSFVTGMYGIIAGLVIYLTAKSNIFLGALKFNEHALMIIALFAGFSESYVSRILETIDKQHDK